MTISKFSIVSHGVLLLLIVLVASLGTPQVSGEVLVVEVLEAVVQTQLTPFDFKLPLLEVPQQRDHLL